MNEDRKAETVGNVILEKLQNKAAFHLYANACLLATLPVDTLIQKGLAQKALGEIQFLAQFVVAECKRCGLDFNEVARTCTDNDPLASFVGTMQ